MTAIVSPVSVEPRLSDARRRRLVDDVRAIALRHAVAVPRHDEAGTIHTALVADLCAAGYHLAPLDRRYGGGEYGLPDVVMAQVALAETDAATALGFGMHLMAVGGETASLQWMAGARHRLFSAVARNSALVNVLATEPIMGSPQGDQRPATALIPNGDGRWHLYGQKSYATFAETIQYAVVYASFEDGSGDVGRVLVPMRDMGVGIEHTWDTVGMRGTASHTVHFSEIALDDTNVLVRHAFEDRTRRPAMSAWFALPAAAAYLGIARTARDEAVAAFRQPREGRRPAAEADGRRNIAEIEWRLASSEALLMAAAAEADQQDGSPGLSPLAAAAKLQLTRTAIEVVDLACRVAGGESLRRGSRLERAWRDVRCGTVHPPTDAAAQEILAAGALSGAH